MRFKQSYEQNNSLLFLNCDFILKLRPLWLLPVASPTFPPLLLIATIVTSLRMSSNTHIFLWSVWVAYLYELPRLYLNTVGHLRIFSSYYCFFWLSLYVAMLFCFAFQILHSLLFSSQFRRHPSWCWCSENLGSRGWVISDDRWCRPTSCYSKFPSNFSHLANWR